MDYKISVIIPVYNAAKFLKESMDSLIAQTIGFEHLQVIMVDDCSRDESFKMLKEYAQQYSNVEVYQTEVNSGAAGTPRNIALEHVKAPYIMFLDPDDYYDPDACRALYDRIIQTDVEIVGGYCCYVGEDGRLIACASQGENERYLYGLEDYIEYFNTWGGFCNGIYDASFIESRRIRFTLSGYGEDTAFICKCVANQCRYIYVPTLVLNYRQNDDSATHVLTERYFEKCLPSIEDIRTALAPYEEVCQWRLEQLAGYYFCQSVQAYNLDKDALVRIYEECRELFIEPKGSVDQKWEYALKLISSGRYEEVAEYALIIREYEKQYRDVIRQYENRFIIRFVDDFKQGRFRDWIKLCFAFVKSRLHR